MGSWGIPKQVFVFLLEKCKLALLLSTAFCIVQTIKTNRQIIEKISLAFCLVVGLLKVWLCHPFAQFEFLAILHGFLLPLSSRVTLSKNLRAFLFSQAVKYVHSVQCPYLVVAACIWNRSGQHSTRFEASIKCIYRGSQDRINCHWACITFSGLHFIASGQN